MILGSKAGCAACSSHSETEVKFLLGRVCLQAIEKILHMKLFVGFCRSLESQKVVM